MIDIGNLLAVESGLSTLTWVEDADLLP